MGPKKFSPQLKQIAYSSFGGLTNSRNWEQGDIPVSKVFMSAYEQKSDIRKCKELQ